MENVSLGFWIAQVQWEKGICSQERVKPGMSTPNIHVYLYFSGKRTLENAALCYNRHVLRTNNFGFFQERAPNQQSQRVFRLLLISWLSSASPPAQEEQLGEG